MKTGRGKLWEEEPGRGGRVGGGGEGDSVFVLESLTSHPECHNHCLNATIPPPPPHHFVLSQIFRTLETNQIFLCWRRTPYFLCHLAFTLFSGWQAKHEKRKAGKPVSSYNNNKESKQQTIIIVGSFFCALIVQLLTHTNEDKQTPAQLRTISSPAEHNQTN